MPTVGWVLETNEERITDAFHCAFVPPQPEPVECPLCRVMLLGANALEAHLALEHPVRRPLLRVGGLLNAVRLRVNSSATLQDVAALNCTSLEIATNSAGFERLEPAQLAERLQTVGNAHHRIRLHNRRALDAREAVVEVEITVAIPSETILAEIDSAFLGILAVDAPTLRDVDRFCQVIPQEPAARDYAGALADYVIGLLTKTQDRAAGAQRPFDVFKEKFSSARHVLADFPRPVPRAVVAVIDFNLNRFSDIVPMAMPQLRSGHRFFSALAPARPMPDVERAEATCRMDAVCPIDPCTAAILDAFEAFPKVPAIDEPTGLLPGFGKLPVSEFDQAKVRALKATGAIVFGERVIARGHLRHLQHDVRFGSWARRILATEEQK